MTDLVPAPAGLAAGSPAALPANPAPSLLAPLTDPGGGPALTRLGTFGRQPAVRAMLPWFLGVAAIGGAALAWSAVGPSPQRMLYSQLEDGERASVAAALDQAAIGYAIDNSTGAITVDEADFYRARMLVAQDGALAAPETGAQMLDNLPMGASRNLEGERLRGARERDLELTVGEIDGVESVRVHLAEAEKSVFVRDDVPPSASVMVRLKGGRQLSASQVSAIVNLVGASVPGLSADAVRVVDQHGRLLSEGAGADHDRLDLQARMEDKLRAQVAALLRPMLGADNFSSEIQIDLDMNEVTQAREAYDKDGVVRSESQEQSQTSASGQAAGVPGVLSNTPPPATQATAAPPQGTAPATGQAAPTTGQSQSSRTYELGREVSVTNQTPGGIRRISVAVAISKEALKGAKAQDVADIQALVSAAVGADARRGDTVKVVMRAFEPADEVAVPFYEAPWFATIVRYGAAVIAVLLVLLMGVRPLVKLLRGDAPKKGEKNGKNKAGEVNDEDGKDEDGGDAASGRTPVAIPGVTSADPALSRAELLSMQVDLAQRLVAEKPESAVAALRQMLVQTEAEKA